MYQVNALGHFQLESNSLNCHIGTKFLSQFFPNPANVHLSAVKYQDTPNHKILYKT